MGTITYTEDDFDLPKILDKNNYLDGFNIKYTYHIFGLRRNNRPHVRLITRNPAYTMQLMSLFHRSNLSLDVVKDTTERTVDRVNIGIRRDIRHNTAMTRKLIKTIIYSLEGKLTLGSKFKIDLGRRVKPGRTWDKKKDNSKLDDSHVSLDLDTSTASMKELHKKWEATLKAAEALEPKTESEPEGNAVAATYAAYLRSRRAEQNTFIQTIEQTLADDEYDGPLFGSVATEEEG